MIAIIDYGAGNLGSVTKALNYIGCETCVTGDARAIMTADAAVLPGVGSFGSAMESLRRAGLDGVIRDFAASGKPFLGICLGMQLMFEGSEESGGVEGISLFRGRFVKFPADMGLKVPHMGWNSLTVIKHDAIMPPRDGEYVYFVHSYCLETDEPGLVSSVADYGVKVNASVSRGNVFACQFHPEKSGAVGLDILRRFACVVNGEVTA